MDRWLRSGLLRYPECTVRIVPNSVTRALNGIDGVAARVNLHANRAEVLMDRMVDEDELKHAVEEAGYGVVDIKAS